ncbi:hypothetical protein THIOM_004901 [Candidatus Thiomargarita nelsonii]|uniref:Uncharacterized protein n=1 Tax=Candidatus Thiomargarita nelsonii TaxID=1003181 RepID=A0A176RUN5_9GAMM|nr:hypothetical protein THIOM_004901 [Candidatus Thiomargarita nelsonii]
MLIELFLIVNICFDQFQGGQYQQFTMLFAPPRQYPYFPAHLKQTISKMFSNKSSSA